MLRVRPVRCTRLRWRAPLHLRREVHLVRDLGGVKRVKNSAQPRGGSAPVSARAPATRRDTHRLAVAAFDSSPPGERRRGSRQVRFKFNSAAPAPQRSAAQRASRKATSSSCGDTPAQSMTRAGLRAAEGRSFWLGLLRKAHATWQLPCNAARSASAGGYTACGGAAGGVERSAGGQGAHRQGRVRQRRVLRLTEGAARAPRS